MCNIHKADENDTTPVYPRLNYLHYNPCCGWCWLGAQHTYAAHEKELAEHEKREMDKWTAIAGFASAKLGRAVDPLTIRVRYSDNPAVVTSSMRMTGERIAEREGAIQP